MADSNPRDFKCTMCGAEPGHPCVKPSGVKTRPHAERRRLVTAKDVREFRFFTEVEARCFIRGVTFADNPRRKAIDIKYDTSDTGVWVAMVEMVP